MVKKPAYTFSNERLLDMIDQQVFKKRFSVATPAQKKRALDISKLAIYPKPIMLMDRKNFVSKYIGYLEAELKSVGSLKDRMGFVVEIMSLYEETNKEASQVYLRTTDNFVNTLPLVADALNRFYNANEMLIGSMHKMLYGAEVQVRKLSSDKDLEKAKEEVLTVDNGLTELMV